MMTKYERETLLKVVRQRERVAKTEAAAVAAARRAEFAQQLAREFRFDEDKIWKQAIAEAQATWAKAAREIAARCHELGIPREFAPSMGGASWYGRGENAVASRRAELTRVANTRIEQNLKEAKAVIEKGSVEIQERILADGLESVEAKAFLEAMPKPEQLLPPPPTVAEAQRALAAANDSCSGRYRNDDPAEDEGDS